MYVQYKLKSSGYFAIRFKKCVTICFPKGGIRGDHVLLLSPPQINRLDRVQAEGRRVQIRMSTRQVAKNVSYTGGFLGMLASLTALVRRLVEMDSSSKSMANAIRCRSAKVIVSI